MAVAVAAAALCSATALPAVAEESAPGDDPSASADESLLAELDSTATSPAPSSSGAAADTSSPDTTGDTSGDTTGDRQEDTPGQMPEDSLSSSTGNSTAGSLKVSPSVVAAGAEVQVHVEDCKGSKVMARSEAFVADAQLAAKGGGGLHAEAKIRSTTSPGTYKVRCDCGGEAPLTVVARGSTPTAPVKAGGGGTARAVSKDADGPGVAHVIVGAGLAGAAGLAVAGIALHRRRAGSAGD
ncbi:hypothetical protein [Streptomyces sp. 8N706]|uniref:hypothetical protein n=1 Tax=Streptomyces sp. 8N706 TaxID=3457416 RepID=UPI003FD22696